MEGGEPHEQNQSKEQRVGGMPRKRSHGSGHKPRRSAVWPVDQARSLTPPCADSQKNGAGTTTTVPAPGGDREVCMRKFQMPHEHVSGERSPFVHPSMCLGGREGCRGYKMVQ